MGRFNRRALCCRCSELVESSRLDQSVPLHTISVLGLTLERKDAGVVEVKEVKVPTAIDLRPLPRKALFATSIFDSSPCLCAPLIVCELYVTIILVLAYSRKLGKEEIRRSGCRRRRNMGDSITYYLANQESPPASPMLALFLMKCGISYIRQILTHVPRVGQRCTYHLQQMESIVDRGETFEIGIGTSDFSQSEGQRA